MTTVVRHTEIDGILLMQPKIYSDERGKFFESFREEDYRSAGIADNFVQENISQSKRGVLRGLHFQVKHPQAQIVTVLMGSVFDVVVDLRPNSKTFGRWLGFELCSDSPMQIYMAPGFAHGFYVSSEFAQLHYKVSCYYDPSDESGLLWSDDKIGISWPNMHPIVGLRDSSYPKLSEFNVSGLPHL
jgi:dTDP-4-dehydrorhamnose 3,5-epimerase